MVRERAVARIKLRLERLHSPRLHMTLIVALTGVAGLLSSFVLLHLGIESLWLRYPLVVVLAYAFFLALLWCWLRLKRDDFSDPGVDLPDSGVSSGEPATFAQSWGGGGGRGGGGGASGSFDDATLDAPLSPRSLGSSLPDSGGRSATESVRTDREHSGASRPTPPRAPITAPHCVIRFRRDLLFERALSVHHE